MKKENNVNVDALLMDDDCETFAKVRNELTHNVEKWGDQNHTGGCLKPEQFWKFLDDIFIICEQLKVNF